MFRHIVLLSFTEGTTGEDVSAIVDALHTLPERVPTIRQYVVGTDAGLAEGNADLTAIADFDDQAGYEVYRDHDAHQQVITELIKPRLAGRTATQFEL